jgi:DNA-directed RNA polymerase subunit RPC12/RpoP
MTCSAATAADGVPKSMLFCPDCGHQSRYDGDWVRVETAGTLHYCCPTCGTEITARPTEPITESNQTTPDFWRTWERSIQSWQEFWQQILSPG